MDRIEQIYYNFNILSDNLPDLPEIKEKEAELWTYMDHRNFFGNAGISKTKLELEGLVIALASANEKQGFIRGFQYATELLSSKRGCKHFTQAIDMRDELQEIEVLMERIDVLSEDLINGFFDTDAYDKENTWQISGHFFECARVKAQMVVGLVSDIRTMLTELQEIFEDCEPTPNDTGTEG